MSKKILILSGSPRKGGNSDILCDEFMRGAQDTGHTVEKIFIRDQRIGYCNACYACRESGVCVLKDGMQEVLEKMAWADVIVMASPVYFYSIDAQMKAVIEGLKESGYRGNAKVCIGGPPTSPAFAQEIGADHRDINAQDCVNWLKEQKVI